MLGSALLLLAGMAATAGAQGPPVHALHAGAMPPGAIGSQRLLRGGPLSGYYQPTELIVPEGVVVGVPHQQGFTDSHAGNPVTGLLVGQVYRFRLSNIPLHRGVVLYPTVELIDRLYPPPGQATKFPVPVEITPQELDMAARGMFVTRVIYVEDPLRAMPDKQLAGQPWFEVGEGEDPLAVADQLGRPIAILRLGGRDWGSLNNDPRANYGCPPLIDCGTRPARPVEPTVP